MRERTTRMFFPAVQSGENTPGFGGTIGKTCFTTYIMHEINTMVMPEWFEDSGFWEKLYPFLFPESSFDDASEQADQILSLLPEPGRKVLDLCCGPGRISLPLAERGFEVTGVDITGFHLEKGKRRVQNGGNPVEWVESDMRHFLRPDSFDLILNLYTSFGYCNDPADDLKILKNVVTNLKTGGTFLIELMGKEVLARIFQPTCSIRIDDGLFVQCHEILNGWGRIRNEWIIISGETVHRFVFEHTLYSAKELTDLCILAGLTDISVYGGLDGRPYDTGASRLVLTGKKEI